MFAVDRALVHVAKIGVVTVTFNSESVIHGFMQSILTQTHASFRLYVIDNDSRDSTLEEMEKYTDRRITVIQNNNNLGVAEGNNQGIVAALKEGCDHILLLNNDTEFGPDLLACLLEEMAALNADMIVPKIMFFDLKNVVWCAGGYFRKWNGYSTGHRGEGIIDGGQFNQPKVIQYAPTCCMLIGATVFSKVGLMDPLYFVYYDDTDFCWRANVLGISLWYTPKAIVYHKVSSLTGGNSSDFSIRHATRNRVYFVLKNMGVFQKVCCLLLYQIIFFSKLLLFRDSWRIYKMKVAAYKEGITHFQSARKNA